jgi:hypothetical protein
MEIEKDVVREFWHVDSGNPGVNLHAILVHQPVECGQVIVDNPVHRFPAGFEGWA